MEPIDEPYNIQIKMFQKINKIGRKKNLFFKSKFLEKINLKNSEFWNSGKWKPNLLPSAQDRFSMEFYHINISFLEIYIEV